MSETANDQAPEHYNRGDQEQHWDRMWQLYREAWFVGNVTKYVERYRKKDGMKDLRKAKHYLDKLIELEQAELTPSQSATIKFDANGVCLCGVHDVCPLGKTGSATRCTVQEVRAAKLHEATLTPSTQRTRSQVLKARESAVMGGCCNRFADNQGCNCLELALADDEPIIQDGHGFGQPPACDTEGHQWEYVGSNVGVGRRCKVCGQVECDE